MEVDVSDAVVRSVTILGDRIEVAIHDWQESPALLVFADPLAVQDFGLVGEELSHITESAEDSLLSAACERAGEAVEAYTCFHLFGTWSDVPIMRVVATSLASSKV